MSDPSGEPATAPSKPVHLGAPIHFALDLALRPVWAAFPDAYGIYLVGSVLERPDWRDVDLRMIMPDDVFAREFPQALGKCQWEHDPKWMILTIGISAMLRNQTGLPIDFQFQPQSWANERHHKPRHAMGFVLVSASDR